MSKKIFIISAVVFLFVVIGLAVQYFWFGKKEPVEQPAPVEEPLAEPAENKPVISSQKIKKLVDGNVVGVVINADGSKLRYFQGSSFLEIDFEGTAKNPVGAYPLKDVLEILWSSTKKQAIIRTSSGFYVYDLDSDQVTKLKDGIDVAVWSAHGDKIIYKYYEKTANRRSINIADPDGENWRMLTPLNYKLVDFAINPNSGEITYYPMPDSFTNGQLEGVNFSGENKRLIFEGRFGSDFLHSPDGKKLLISNVTEKGGKIMDIGVSNEQGGEFRTLSFPSSVRKCVWSKDNVTVYCAMMVGVKDGSVMPNDWQDGHLELADTFWKINIQNGKKERLLELQEITQPFDAENLLLDPEEKYLFFLDKRTGEPYRIEL